MYGNRELLPEGLPVQDVTISVTKKLVYLRHSLKDGSAKFVIEGLSRSGEQYVEAIESLKSHYSRPQLIHQTHFRKMYEVPRLREGTSKELRRLHNTVQQHLRALKAMGQAGPIWIIHHFATGIEIRLQYNL